MNYLEIASNCGKCLLDQENPLVVRREQEVDGDTYFEAREGTYFASWVSELRLVGEPKRKKADLKISNYKASCSVSRLQRQKWFSRTIKQVLCSSGNG